MVYPKVMRMDLIISEMWNSGISLATYRSNLLLKFCKCIFKMNLQFLLLYFSFYSLVRAHRLEHGGKTIYQASWPRSRLHFSKFTRNANPHWTFNRQTTWHNHQQSQFGGYTNGSSWLCSLRITLCTKYYGYPGKKWISGKFPQNNSSPKLRVG